MAHPSEHRKGSCKNSRGQRALGELARAERMGERWQKSMVSQGLTKGSNSLIQQRNPHLSSPGGTQDQPGQKRQPGSQVVTGTRSGATLLRINPRPGGGLDAGTPKDMSIS